MGKVERSELFLALAEMMEKGLLSKKL